MNKFFKSVASYSWGVLLFALLFLAAGICLIAFPGDALPTAVLTISIITIVFGVVLILIALLDKKRQAKFFFFLLGGAYPDPAVYTLQHYMNNMYNKLNYPYASAAAYSLNVAVFAFFSILFLIQKMCVRKMEGEA